MPATNLSEWEPATPASSDWEFASTPAAAAPTQTATAPPAAPNPYVVARPNPNAGLVSTTAGAPQQLNAGAPGAGAALGKALATGFKEAQDTSFLDDALPEWEVDPHDSKKLAAGKSIYNVLTSLPKFATSGAGFESMIPGMAAPKLTKAAFSAGLYKNLYDTASNAYKNWDTMTPAQKMQAVVQGAASGLFGTVLGGSAAKDFKGGENNATRTVRTDQGSTSEGGETPQGGKTDSSGNVQQGAPQPPEPVGAREEGKKTGGVNPYRVEQEEGGKYVVTAPDGSLVSEHSNHREASMAAENLFKPPEQKAAPAISEVQKVSRDVFQMGTKDFFDWAKKLPNTMTGEAYRVGQAAKTPQDVAELKNKVDVLRQKIQDPDVAKDPDKGMAIAAKIQFYNEAHGAATGTGSAGEWLAQENPNYKPPFPARPTPKLPPEAQGHLDAVSKELGAKVELVSDTDKGNPFASRLKGNIATIDRNTGKVLVNPAEFNDWLKEVPEASRRLAVKSVIAEEQNHLATDDSAAKAYWGTLSGAERRIIQNRYGKAQNMNDTLWGHEAVNFELQRLARMTPHQVLAAARSEKWKLKSLAVLETTIRGIRKVLGTKASQEGLAILDQVQKNIDMGRIAMGNRGKADAAAKAVADKDADKLESMADMYIQSGDAKTGEAMKATAARIRSEQSPSARPRKRNESVFQDKFFLPGEATQKPSGSTQAVPISGESPTVPPGERVSAEAAGALPRLTGEQLRGKAATWIETGMDKVSKDLASGKQSEPPSFKEFKDYMKGQQPEIKPGQISEMWHEEIGQALDNASGEKLGDLVKAIWGRQVTEASAVGRKGFFRGIISGSQKVADLPKTGQFKLAQDVYNRTPAERYQDERKVAAIARNRDKVIGALFNKLVKPVMEDIRLSDKETTPEDLRYGGGKAIPAVHEFSEQDERNPKLLGEELVDESRRSKNDPLTASKRLTAIVDRKSGSVDLVSTYKHPSLGTMLVDPLSPERQHSPLDSMLRRYRVIGSYLRDTPVQKFKQHFKNLADFNDSFANEARRQYQNETSYDPESVSAEQFQREIGGRMQGTQEGHLMGPGKQLVTASGQSQLEKSQRTPMTTPEAHSILDYIHEQQGTIDSADDVREAMLTLKEDMNHQALSGLIKLARGLQEKHPDLSNEELLNLVAQRIYENNRDAENLDQFAKRTMAESRPTHVEDAGPEDSPAAINRKALDRKRDEIHVKVSRFYDSLKATLGRGPTHEKMTTALDAADTLGNVDSRQVGESVRFASRDEKNFYGKKMILYAAKAKIAAGAIKARYHYDHHALDEADRLMKEDPDIKKVADFANRPRDVKNQQLMLEGEVANKALGTAIQQKLIESGFLTPRESTLYHDSMAKDNLGKLREFVRQGKEQALRMQQGDAFSRFVGRRWERGADQAMEELDFAEAHWNDPELIDTAMRFRKEMDLQYDLEKMNGYDISYDPNYMPGRHDGELFMRNKVLFSGIHILGRDFRQEGTFANNYEAIGKGPYVPATRDISNLAESRARAGMRSLNRLGWWNGLKGVKDEISGLPIVADPKEDAKTGRKGPPSTNYRDHFRTPGGDEVWVLDGYEGVVHSLMDPSAIRNNLVGKAALASQQFLKHTVLAGDLFHYARVGYYARSIAGKNARWRPGWAALDFREADLPKAVASRMISQETADELLAPLPFKAGGVKTTRNSLELSKEFQRQGFNAGQIRDAIYKDLVKNVPGFGQYARFLFDRYTRGHMMQAALTEYKRRSALDPDMDSREIIRDIAKHLNPYFGSIGRQGWIRSRTFQDMAQLGFLAPQWTEGLIKKELAPVRLLTAPRKAWTGRDTALRGMGRGLLAMFALTQVLNYIYRGQPTWKNKEKGHMWDAYLGDNVWLSPLAVFNEITGDMIRLYGTKPKAWDVVQQIGENKLGFYGRAAVVLATDKSSSGQYLTTTRAVLTEAARQLVPTPITFGTAGKAGLHAAFPNQFGPVPPGRLKAQLMSVAGLKTHTGQDVETVMEQSAAAFNKKNGKHDATIIGYTDDPSLSQLRYLLKIGDVAGAKRLMATLAPNGQYGKLNDSMNKWSKRPFTGSARTETTWVTEMSPDERSQYGDAMQERYELLGKYYDALNTPP